ncbi:hypothetical protein [Sporosarcina highlanderae]|uniref:DUF4352 domain-containing protein n=1 Tax=Sporosarcina highlanderae TaxID=3035916 RepID=A0ABT8JU58_9BACL|nr:hypothetical protein [Sporosarcina highlanderae]MDN4608655.1 hypothetical protein [Sporosarcina highlanderae]
MKKIYILFVAAFVLILGACAESGVSTGGDGNSVESKNTGDKKGAPKKDDGSKLVDATAQTTEAAGLKVNLGEIKISEDRIAVGMNIENTTTDVLTFYPDMGGTVVIGDMQLDANFMYTEGSIGGEIQSGVKKDGVIVFLVSEGKTIDISAVKELKFIFGDVTTSDYMTSEPVNFTVPVQE